MTLVRAFAVRLHTTDCSLRDTEAVLTALDVERSHQAIFQWIHRLTDNIPDPSTEQPSRVAVDETAVRVKRECLGCTLNRPRHEVDSRRCVVWTARHRSGGCISIWCRRETQSLRHRVSCRPVRLSDCPLSAWAEQSGRLHRPKPHRKVVSDPLKRRVDRFHNSWVDSRRSVRQLIALFTHYYNHLRQYQSLDGRTSIEEVLN
jgi:putative transposase